MKKTYSIESVITVIDWGNARSVLFFLLFQTHFEFELITLVMREERHWAVRFFSSLNSTNGKPCFSCGSFFSLFFRNREVLSGKQTKNQINKWTREPYEEKKATIIYISINRMPHTLVAAKKCTQCISFSDI